jgi:pimeloyl-ACP methyl ester carboxylesterase
MERLDVRFASGEDECAAWLFLPSGEAGPWPCVVMCTGLSFVRDQGLDAFGERFAAAGLAALAIDYRHFGDSGGEPRGLISASRQRGDLRAALAYAGARPELDRARIAIWGYSLGGANAQALILERPQGIAAAIFVTPVVSGLRSLLHIGGPPHPLRLAWAGLRDALRALRGAEPFRVPAAGPPGSTAVLNSPDSAPGCAAITPPRSTWRNEICARVALAPPYSLARQVRKIACPTLYCITEDDDVNPPALGRTAASRAPAAELLLYPGNHFSRFQGATLEQMAADQIDFLRRHLGPGPDRRLRLRLRPSRRARPASPRPART